MAKADEALVKIFIDRLSHRGSAWFLRFAKSGHPLFEVCGPYYEYFHTHFESLGGMTPAISKEFGHDETAELKTDVLLEVQDEGKIALWLTWSVMDLEWYIRKWVYGYTTAMSTKGFFSVTEGVRAWIEGDYKLEKVDGTYRDD